MARIDYPKYRRRLNEVTGRKPSRQELVDTLGPDAFTRKSFQPQEPKKKPVRDITSSVPQNAAGTTSAAPKFQGGRDQFFEDLAKNNPDKNPQVLEAGVQQLRESVRQGHMFADKPLTVDDVEKMGLNRLKQQEQGWLETMGKGAVRGVEQLAGGIGSTTRWLGDVTNIETLSEAGEVASDYWEKAAQKGWAKQGPYTYRGKGFMDAPSFKRAAGIVTEALPSFGAAIIASVATGSPMAGAGMLGLLEGAPQYEEAREAGKGELAASGAGAASTVGTALLEYLPISRILKRGGFGKAGKEAAEGAFNRIWKGGSQEALQEASQELWQNTIAKVGYDDTRNLAEGLIEAMIGGAGAGGIGGGAVGAGQKRAQKAVDKAKQQGVSDEEIEALRNDLQQQMEQTAGMALHEMPDDQLSNWINEASQAAQENPDNQKLAETANILNREYQRRQAEQTGRGARQQLNEINRTDETVSAMDDETLKSAYAQAFGAVQQAPEDQAATRELRRVEQEMENRGLLESMAEPAPFNEPAITPADEAARQRAAAETADEGLPAGQAPPEQRVENLTRLRRIAQAQKRKAKGKSQKKEIQQKIDRYDQRIHELQRSLGYGEEGTEGLGALQRGRQEEARGPVSEQEPGGRQGLGTELQGQEAEAAQGQAEKPAALRPEKEPSAVDQVLQKSLEKDIQEQAEIDSQITAAELRNPELSTDANKVIETAWKKYNQRARAEKSKKRGSQNWDPVRKLRDRIVDATKGDQVAIRKLRDQYAKKIKPREAEQAEYVSKKRQKEIDDYNKYVESLTGEQKKIAGDLIKKEPKNPRGLRQKIERTIAQAEKKGAENAKAVRKHEGQVSPAVPGEVEKGAPEGQRGAAPEGEEAPVRQGPGKGGQDLQQQEPGQPGGAGERITSVTGTPEKANRSDGNWVVRYETEKPKRKGTIEKTKAFFKKKDAEQWIKDNQPQAEQKEPWQMTREEFKDRSKITRYGKKGESGVSIVLPDGRKEWIKPGAKEIPTAIDKRIQNGYKRTIEQAWEKGKSVPLELRREADVGIEPWEITLNDSIKNAKKQYGENVALDNIQKKHKMSVRQALSEGKSVPEEVLAEYPDLKSTDQTRTEAVPEAAPKETPTKFGPGDTAYIRWEATGKDEPVNFRGYEGNQAIVVKDGQQMTVPVNDLKTEPETETAPKSVPVKELAVQGENAKTYLPDNTEVDVQYAVTSIDDLIASHDVNMNENPAYPQKLQPRDRARSALRVQVEQMANKLNPERLGESASVSAGAPVVGPDMVVESGNGRAVAIKKAYTGKKGEQYQQWLENNAEKFGLSREDVSGIENPVLVRIRRSEVADRAEFAKKANQAETAVMGPAETAKADAERLTNKDLGIFAPSEEGDITTASNRSFMTAFMSKLGTNESAGYITSDGRYTKQFVDRVKAAVFYKAYQNDDLITLMAEEADPGIKNLLNALTVAASKFVQARNVNESKFNQTQVTDHITSAIKLVKEAKGEGFKIEDYLRQTRLFEENIPDVTRQLALFIENNKRSAKRQGIMFKEVGDRLYREISDRENQSLPGMEFGDINISEIVDESIKKVEELYARDKEAGQTKLFGEQPGPGVSERTGEGQQRGYRRTAAGVAGIAGRSEEQAGEAGKPGEVKEPEHVKGTFLKEPTQADKVSFRQQEIPFGRPQETGEGAEAAGEVSAPAARVVMRTTGQIAAEGNTVHNVADVASLLSHLRTSPQERIYTVATDKNGTVLEVHEYGKGSKQAAYLSPVEIAGPALDVDGAEKVYFVHNHPSESAGASPQDRQVFAAIKEILSLKNIDTEAVVIGGNKYQQFGVETEDNPQYEVRDSIRKTSIPTKERAFTEEALGAEQGPQLSNPQTAIDYIKSTYNNADGILALYPTNRPIAFIPMPTGKKMTDAAREIVDTLNKLNASRVIVNSKTTAFTTSRKRFFQEMARLIGGDVEVLDIISEGISLADRKRLAEYLPSSLSPAGVVERLDGGQVLYLRGAPPASGLKATDIKSNLAPKIANFRNAPQVEYVQSETDLPEVIQNDIKAKNAAGEVVAVWHRGKIHFVADNIRNSRGAETAMLHEIFGHYGVESVIPRAQAENYFLEIFRSKKGEAQRIANMYEIDTTTREGKIMAAREVVAHMAQTGVQDKMLDRIVNMVREGLRKVGLDLKLSNAEIRQLIVKGAKYVEGADRSLLRRSGTAEAPAYQITAFHGSPHDITQTPEGRFTTQRIGTGEGAQAFGWGLYFTDIDQIAKHYAEMGARRRVIYEGEDMTIDEFQDHIQNQFGFDIARKARRFAFQVSSGEYMPDILKEMKRQLTPGAYNIIENISEGMESFRKRTGWRIYPKGGQRTVNKMSKEEERALWDIQGRASWLTKNVDALNSIKTELQKTIEAQKTWLEASKRGEATGWSREEIEKTINDAQTGLDIIEKYDLQAKYQKPVRNLYQVSIHKGKDTSEYTWLDWYQPVSDEVVGKIHTYLQKKGQADFTDSFKKAVKENNLDGRELYRELAEFRGSEKAASLFLLDAGVDGIRYPSGTLSGVKEGEGNNYVVFDENAVTIEDHIQYARRRSMTESEKNQAAMQQEQQLVNAGIDRFRKFLNEMVDDRKGAINAGKWMKKTGTQPPTLNPKDFPKHINSILTPYNYAQQDAEFKKLFEAEMNSKAFSHQLTADDRIATETYYELKDKSKVDRALMAGDEAVKEYSDQDLQSKFNLTEDEVAAYRGVRQVLNDKLKRIVSSSVSDELTEQTGLDKEAIADMVVKARSKEDLSKQLKEMGVDEDGLSKLSWLFDWAKQHKGYIPHKWKSEWRVRVVADGETWMLDVPSVGAKVYPTAAAREKAAQQNAIQAAKKRLNWNNDRIQKAIENTEQINELRRRRDNLNTRLDTEKNKTAQEKIEAKIADINEQLKELEEADQFLVIHHRDLPVDLFEDVDQGLVKNIAEAATEAAWQDIETDFADKEYADRLRQAIRDNVEKLYLAKGGLSHLIGRKGVKGYRQDIDNVLAEYLTGVNALIAKHEKARNFANAFKDINPRRSPEKWRYGKQYISDMLGESSEAGWFKRFAGTWFLGLDLSAAALNFTQNFTHGASSMRRIKPKTDKVPAETDIYRAMRDVTKEYFDAKRTGRQMYSKGTSWLSEDEVKAVRSAMDRGFLDPAFLGEVTGFHKNAILDTRVIQEGVFKLFTGTEALNRMNTFLAAYRRAKREHGGDPAAAEAYAVDKGVEIVNSSHFVYGRGNRPELIRKTGALGNISYTFMTYPINNLIWLKLNAQQTLKDFHKGDRQAVKDDMRVLGSNLGYLFAFGGMGALPFIYLAQAVVNLFDDDDEDWETLMRRHTPKPVGTIVTKGIPAFFGNDFSFRVQGTDVFGAPIGLQIAGMMKRRAEKAADLWDQYEYGAAVFHLMPDFIRNPYRAYMGYTEGGTRRGVPPIKYGAGEAAWRALGFSPTRESETYEATGAARKQYRRRLDKLDGFAERLLAYQHSPREIRELKKDVRRYNAQERKKGARGLPISWGDIVSSAKSRRTAKQKGYTEKLPQYMEQYQRNVYRDYGLRK